MALLGKLFLSVIFLRFEKGVTNATGISKVVHINSSEQLKEIIDREKRVVCVKFTASWCRPCRMISPELDRLSVELQDKLAVLSVDVDQNPELTEEAGVRGMPTFAFFVEKKNVHTFAGADTQRRRFLDCHNFVHGGMYTYRVQNF